MLTKIVASAAGGPARRFAVRLRDCTSGLALTEFAYALPVLLTLGLFGLETANYAMAHLRISNIAMMTADGAARVRDSIDEADVVELFTGSKMTGTGIDFAQNGRIILSSVEQSPDGTRQWIRWQRCDGVLDVNPGYGRPLTQTGTQIVNGTEIYNSNRTTASTNPSAHHLSTLTAIGPAENQISAGSGTAVMVVEVSYDYQPIIPHSFLAGRRIRYESAFNVRQRTDQAIKNINRLTPRSCNTRQA